MATRGWGGGAKRCGEFFFGKRKNPFPEQKVGTRGGGAYFSRKRLVLMAGPRVSREKSGSRYPIFGFYAFGSVSKFMDNSFVFLFFLTFFTLCLNFQIFLEISVNFWFLLNFIDFSGIFRKIVEKC